ncbi:hypothetical protein LDENG_00283720 [Lucifuga dentata]|nr:hypothetical protein LDENG_00283720 [Lucifuga dentata]
MVNLEFPIHLTCMSFGGGRKPEHLEGTHADKGRTCKLHTERPCPGRESNPGPSCCEATVLTTAPPCRPFACFLNFFFFFDKYIFHTYTYACKNRNLAGQ